MLIVLTSPVLAVTACGKYNCTKAVYRPNAIRLVTVLQRTGLLCYVMITLRKPMLHTGAQAEGIQ